MAGFHFYSRTKNVRHRLEKVRMRTWENREDDFWGQERDCRCLLYWAVEVGPLFVSSQASKFLWFKLSAVKCGTKQ